MGQNRHNDDQQQAWQGILTAASARKHTESLPLPALESKFEKNTIII